MMVDARLVGAVALATVVGAGAALAFTWAATHRTRDRTDDDDDMKQMLKLLMRQRLGGRERERDGEGRSAGSSRGTSRANARQTDPDVTRAMHMNGDGTEDFTHIVPSMEEIVRQHEAEGDRMSQFTPQEILLQLQQGNTRFWMGCPSSPETNAMERRVMIMNQFPKVAIIGCSDSRVPVEIVFDQGLGDVFVIRVAGNAYGTGVAASIDYAVAHLHVKVVVVLGHEGCGAVRAAQCTEPELAGEPPALKDWLTSMQRGLHTTSSGLNSIRDKRARDREAVIANVAAQLIVIKRNKLIKKKTEAGHLKVVGAFYEITSGMVDFMEDSMADDCAISELKASQLSMDGHL